jgi:diguanylate cyclase (GGDEF)-like protein/PAS domain S-box-containing protein
MRYLPGAAFIKDSRGRYQFVNHSWEEIHGKKMEEVIGRTDANLWPQLAAQFENTEQLVLDKNDVLRSVESFPLPDGIHQYIVHRFPIMDRTGSATLVGGIAIDFTDRLQLERKLQEREAGLRRAQVMARLAHVIAREDGSFESWSESLPQLIGVAADQMPKSAHEWLDRVHPDDRAVVREKTIDVRGNDHRAEIDYRLRHVDGTWMHMRQVIEPVGSRMEAGSSDRRFSTLQDVTEQRKAQEKIERLNRVYAVLSGINAIIVRVRDRRELCAQACRVAVEHGGFGIAWIGTYDAATQVITPTAWSGMGEGAILTSRDLRSDVPGDQSYSARVVREKAAVFDNDLSLTTGTGGAARQEALRRGYGSTIALPLLIGGEVAGTMTLFAKERGFFNADELKLLDQLAGDISFALEHIDKEERLQFLAYHDELTGLPNRALLHDHLGRVIRRAKDGKCSAAVVMCDINRFGHINEALGRTGGDFLLHEIGQRVRNVWPEPDYVGRLSGNCFAGLIGNVNDAADIANFVGKQIAGVMSAPFLVDGQEIRISTTTGIAVYPSDGDDSDSLLRNAEAALRKAKARGDKYLFYHAKMNAAVAETIVMENKLRIALERSEFTLYYQPKVNMADGRINGLEGLIRWNDPVNGLISPAKFIPLLEETGLILDVGEWAIRRAIADYDAWHAAGLSPPRIAVNVSPIQLRQMNFVETVNSAIRQSSSASHGLDLEITESVLMDDIETNTGKLKALRNIGVNIAIDDFGTGYSSLGYLARLPVNLLKIDRSFINGIHVDRDSMTIVTTIISLAHSLGMKVIAEGVELEEQARLLKLLNCDAMQGYLFSKPLAKEQITELLARQRPL